MNEINALLSNAIKTEGVPGSRKTYDIVSVLNSKTLVVCMTRSPIEALVSMLVTEGK